MTVKRRGGRQGQAVSKLTGYTKSCGGVWGLGFGFDRYGEALGLELLLVELCAFFVGGEQEG